MRKKYFRYKAEALINVKNIVTVHDFYFKTPFESEPESHDFWELVFADKGKFRYRRGEEHGELTAGQILFYKPNVVHCIRTESGGEARLVIISFECKSEALKYFEDFTGELSEKLKKYLFELVEEGGRLFDLSSSTPATKKMPEKENPPLGGIQILKNTLELFLIYLLQSETSKKNASAVFLPPRTDEKSLAETVKDFLKENVNGNLTINQICESTFYSRSYLYREFKKATGMPVLTYYNQLKIEKAKKLLTETDLSVSEISAILSYDTPNYFSKQFKKNIGVTPHTYRKVTP